IDGTASDSPGHGGFVTIYAAVANPSGSLQAIYKSTDNGLHWAAVTAPPNYLAGSGNYSNAILMAPGTTTVYVGRATTSNVGATATLQPTDGGTRGTDTSADSKGNGPHVSEHALFRDSQGRLLVANDGGLWRRETSGLWTDLNGNLSISQANSVAAN